MITSEARKTWEQYPVRVTATEKELNQGLYLDSPELLARDYRFHPKLQLVTPAEIAAGYEPSRLDLHYAIYLKNMAEGRSGTDEFYNRTALARGMLSRDRLIEQMGRANNRLYLTRATHRRTLIRSAWVEIYRPPDRYRAFDRDPNGYLLWLKVLREYIEVDPMAYGDLRLRKFCQLAEIVLEFCRERCTTGQLNLEENQAAYLLSEMERIDRMFEMGIKLSEPMRGITHDNDHNEERKDAIMTSKKTKNAHRFAVWVDKYGNFHSYDERTVSSDEPEIIETQEPEIENQPVETGLVSLNDLKRRGRVYRVNEDGEYDNSVDVKHRDELPIYIENVDDFEAHRTGTPVQVLPQSQFNGINLNVNVSTQQPIINAPFELKQPYEIDDEENDDMFDDDDLEEDDEIEDDFGLERDDEMAIELLQRHDKLMTKLDKTNPKKRKKVAELERDLNDIERLLKILQSRGTVLPYRPRKRTGFSRAIRSVKWAIRGVWNAFLDNFEIILPIVGSIGTAILARYFWKGAPEIPPASDPVPA